MLVVYIKTFENTVFISKFICNLQMYLSIFKKILEVIALKMQTAVKIILEIRQLLK